MKIISALLSLFSSARRACGMCRACLGRGILHTGGLTGGVVCFHCDGVGWTGVGA